MCGRSRRGRRRRGPAHDVLHRDRRRVEAKVDEGGVDALAAVDLEVGLRVEGVQRVVVVAADHFVGRYGADLLRLWASSIDYTDDVPFSEEIFTRLGDTYRRIRNTLRILLGNLYDFPVAGVGDPGQPASPMPAATSRPGRLICTRHSFSR